MASNKSIKENKKLSVDDNGYFKVSLDTFLYNAGIVGFIQVLENAKAERDKDYIINGQDLSISKKFLKKSDLSQLYIDSMIKKFGDKTRIYKTIQYIEHIINSKEIEEENFKEEGRPDKWVDLAESTKKQRTKKRKWPGQILQVEGKLAASINTYYDNDSAIIGSNLDYAAIHQLGGLAGKNKKVQIPARPYLKLTDDDFDEILYETENYLKD